MLFAHGFGCDQNVWRYVVPALEEQYQVVLLDYVGAGGSDVSAYSSSRYSSLTGYAQDLLDVCDALELRDVILVGHSVSSMIGVLAAKQEPERFSRLILVAPSPCFINEPSYVGGFEKADLEGLLELMELNMGWAKFLSTAVIKADEHPQLALEMEESFCAMDPEIAEQFARVTFFSDNRADLKHVLTPSLIMQCSEDSLAPREVGAYLHAHLPQSTLTILKATGHCPHMSHPEETVREIKAYLAREGLAC